jgi:hypothetical protein
MVSVEFSSVWVQKAALAQQHDLNLCGISLIEAVPRRLLPLRTHRRQLVKQLPKPSLPAKVFGVDFYYLPSKDATVSRRFTKGPWVWAPSF